MWMVVNVSWPSDKTSISTGFIPKIGDISQHNFNALGTRNFFHENPVAHERNVHV